MILRARIIEERKNYYVADTGTETVPALLKGILRKKHNRLLAGDFVDIEPFESENGTEAVIRKLHPRTNELSKPAIANIDRVFIITAVKNPQLEPDYIDRFLTYLESRSVPAVIVFNKTDLLDQATDQPILSIMEQYQSIGYTTLQVSAAENIGIDAIISEAQNGVSIFAGPSGAGKSTLLSKIFPDFHFATSELSRNINRGVNTTTFTTLFRYHDAFIADTPGFSYLDTPNISPEKLNDCFREFLPARSECRFADCVHINEPFCGIKRAVENGTISESRYSNYVALYRELTSMNKMKYAKGKYSSRKEADMVLKRQKSIDIGSIPL